MPINWNSPLAVSEPDPRKSEGLGVCQCTQYAVHFQLVNITTLL